MKISPKAQAEFDKFVKRRNYLHRIKQPRYRIELNACSEKALRIVKEVVLENIGDKKIVFPDILEDLGGFLEDFPGDLNTRNISDLEKTASFILECVTGESEDKRSWVRKWIVTQLKSPEYANGIAHIRYNGHAFDGSKIYEVEYKGQDYAVFVCVSKDGNMHII